MAGADDAEASQVVGMESSTAPAPAAQNPETAASMDQRQSSDRGNKRRRGGQDAQAGDQGSNHRNKRKDMGRGEWSRNRIDKRARNEEEQAKKRQKTENGESGGRAPALSFSTEEISKEERRPKHKVAVMIGYSGSGYRGLQWNTQEKTIEGDLFAAFVAAGAISKANADDPKKSSLVRCARTDKGVHAAGNMVSLKLIVDEPDIVQKINNHLPPQIRVWGIARTLGSFSCYQECDSRIYEYLIPTHTFLSPHPDSYLGRKLVQLAEEAGDLEGYRERQEEVSNFWPETEEKYIKPVMDSLDNSVKALIQEALYAPQSTLDDDQTAIASDASSDIDDELVGEKESPGQTLEEADRAPITTTTAPTSCNDPDPSPSDPRSLESSTRQDLDSAIRTLKAAYITAKRYHRIPQARLARITAALNHYLGNRNFHNYTVQKEFRDPSAQRQMKSFVISSSSPILTDDGTEWLSLKVHGQSFMMHQIRKMVSMAALVVRCGCPPERIVESYGNVKIPIPKAPGLGLLLERPVFDTYNERAATKFGKERLDFGKYEGEMEAFKQREIYARIFEGEEKESYFHSFFSAIDNFKSDDYLYLSSKGMQMAKARPSQATKKEGDSRKKVKRGARMQVWDHGPVPASDSVAASSGGTLQPEIAEPTESKVETKTEEILASGVGG